MSNFWRNLIIGAGSIFNIFPAEPPRPRFTQYQQRLTRYQRRNPSDDWRHLGGDMNRAFSNLRNMTRGPLEGEEGDEVEIETADRAALRRERQR